MSLLSQFAVAETHEATAGGDIFSALGIDWRLLILQVVAFLILVLILGKFVYPRLMKAVDDRQANIEAAAKAAAQAQKAAEENNVKVAELLDDARKEAAEIVNTAKVEAAELVSASEKKAQKSAERIVADAHEQIEKDVASVRKALYNETLELVALATQKVVGASHDKKADGQLIAKAVEDAR